MKAGAVELLVEESFIPSEGTASGPIDRGELNVSVPNVIDFGVVTYNRMNFYSPVRLCHEWTASVLRKSSEVA
jgi:hypothetical protein